MSDRGKTIDILQELYNMGLKAEDILWYILANGLSGSEAKFQLECFIDDNEIPIKY